EAGIRHVLEYRMTIRGLMTQTVAVGLSLMTGCQTVRTIGDDYSRALSSQPTSQQRSVAAAPASRPPPAAATATTAAPRSPPPSPPANNDAGAPAAPVRPPSHGTAVSLAGKSEGELRVLLGAPTSEEDRPPGKRWRYRDGQCTLDVQLYPDVQTKQFGTLAYEVKSDDNTDEGKRLCLAQLQSRVQSRR